MSTKWIKFGVNCDWYSDRSKSAVGWVNKNDEEDVISDKILHLATTEMGYSALISPGIFSGKLIHETFKICLKSRTNFRSYSYSLYMITCMSNLWGMDMCKTFRIHWRIVRVRQQCQETFHIRIAFIYSPGILTVLTTNDWFIWRLILHQGLLLDVPWLCEQMS